MRRFTWPFRLAALCLAVSPLAASAKSDEPVDPADDVPAETEPPTVEAVDWSASDKNTDYQPKSESEGATWTFNPTKVELSYGKTDTGTNFQGARVLKGNEDVVVQSTPEAGLYAPLETSSRYVQWQGSTLYFGVDDSGSGNQVAGIAEFFWFESSIPRGSDFYAVHLKVKSSPNVQDDWFLSKTDGWFDDWVAQWTSDGPSQHVSLNMEPGGAHGAVRWDFSVPFENYKWEPVKTMQVAESYGAGYSLNANGDANGKASASFKEGGEVAEVTADGKVTIQAKGYVNNDFKVSSQYTITLYKWQMLVSSGAEHMNYQLNLLPHDEQNQDSSGYYEYFIVLQATRGTPIHIDSIELGGMFENVNPFWFDGDQGLSVKVKDLWITPPRGVCLPGDIAPAGTCKSKGVCGVIEPECVDNKWVCPVVNVYEEVEISCDGLDNDCDGKVDEDIPARTCSTKCGTGYETCQNGRFQGCDAPKPVIEICGDGIDNDCDGAHDNGCSVDVEPTDGGTDSTTEPQPTDGVDAADGFDGTNGADGTDGSTQPTDNAGNGNGNNTPGGLDPKTALPSAGGGQSGCSTAGTTSPAANRSAPLLLLLAGALLALRRRR